MVFNSFSFIFLFFPAFFLLFRWLPRRWCPYALIGGSLVFYAIGVRRAPWQLLLLVGLTALGALGCHMLRARWRRDKRMLALWVSVVAAPLAFVKLAGLFLPDPPALPLGLSFYTFQLIAFLVCAWKGGGTTPIDVVAGTLMFPKLISGPIGEAEATLEAVRAPKRNRTRLDAGLEMFILGLAGKVIIADHLGGVLGQVRTWGPQAVSVPLAWIGVLGYALQLYFDFWGYSLMAVGVARMLGMILPDNFNHPYCAVSISEFWRRWHITLGEWFKRHVYIPLGGSRNGMGRMVLSTLTVWLLTGIWHGAGWNYLFWGLMMFALIMGERLLYGKALQKLPVIGHIYVPLMVALSWVFFIMPDLAGASAYFLRLFGAGGAPGDPQDWIKALSWCWPYLALGCAFSTPLPGKPWRRVSGTGAGWALLFVLFWVCMYFLGTAASDPFLYFSF